MLRFNRRQTLRAGPAHRHEPARRPVSEPDAARPARRLPPDASVLGHPPATVPRHDPGSPMAGDVAQSDALPANRMQIPQWQADRLRRIPLPAPRGSEQPLSPLTGLGPDPLPEDYGYLIGRAAWWLAALIRVHELVCAPRRRAGGVLGSRAAVWLRSRAAGDSARAI